MGCENATCLAFETNCFDQTFLKSWFTKLGNKATNVCCEIPGTYLSLLSETR